MAVITVRAKDLTVAPIWATPYLGGSHLILTFSLYITSETNENKQSIF